MANHIKYAISVDLIDEYTQTVSYTNDDDNSVGADVATTQYVHHHDIPFTIGASVSAVTQATGGIEVAADTVVTNYSAGTPTYTSCAADGTKQVVGADNNAYDGVFIKHTGYTDTDLDTRTYNYLAVFIKTAATPTYFHVGSIPSGGCMFIPHVPAVSNFAYYVAASNNVTAGTSADSTVLAQLVTMT